MWNLLPLLRGYNKVKRAVLISRPPIKNWSLIHNKQGISRQRIFSDKRKNENNAINLSILETFESIRQSPYNTVMNFGLDFDYDFEVPVLDEIEYFHMTEYFKSVKKKIDTCSFFFFPF